MNLLYFFQTKSGLTNTKKEVATFHSQYVYDTNRFLHYVAEEHLI